MDAAVNDPSDRDKHQRKRNLVLVSVLLGLAALFFLITIARLGGAA